MSKVVGSTTEAQHQRQSKTTAKLRISN